MTGAELKTIRHRLGLSTTALGRAFGYAGSDVTASGTIRKYESNARPIPPWLARLALMFDRHGVPRGWTSKLHNVIAVLPASSGDDE
jgi:transcriptional regulator with XRE-family HTH domain